MKARITELLSDNRLHGLDGFHCIYLEEQISTRIIIQVGLSILYVAVTRSTVLDISFKK